MQWVTVTSLVPCHTLHVPQHTSVLLYKDGVSGGIYPHQENMSGKCIPPQTPLLYRKTWACRGIPTFLIFDPKHTLWVLIRTSARRNVYQQYTFLANM